MAARSWHIAGALLLSAACGGSRLANDTSADGADAAAPTTACKACVTDADCGAGAACAQLGGDTYCAALCPNGNECGADSACTTLSTASGAQVNACVPRGDACGPSVGVADAGTAPVTGKCGTLDGPMVPSSCASCGSHPCQPNGCYGGWYCNEATKKCQAPPASCTGGSAGGGPFDAGGPATGMVGPNGGAVSRLFFAVVGDTRPATIDDTAGYPSAVISGIYGAMQAANPPPLFAVSTGDYMFATPSGPQAAPQLDLYDAARAKYSGVVFPAMGNHECTGMTASNCGQGQTDGVTVNYSTFLSKMLAPIQKTDPYYSVEIDAIDGSWTAKFVFVAGNAWSPAQASWLAATMAKPTTYTFVVRHEPAAATTAPGVSPSEQIMAQHPYTLSIVGHTHTYGKTGPKQVTIGNGGAPLTGGASYGYGMVSQRPDGAIEVDMIDYTTGNADPSFRFALKPDGTPAP